MDCYDFSQATWRKSLRSAAVNCVEVAETPTTIGVRDSKDRNGPVLRYSPNQWLNFLVGVKNGDFDLPSAR